MQHNDLISLQRKKSALIQFSQFGKSLAPADPIDEYLKIEMGKQNIPGVSLLIIHDGKIVKESAYGYCNLDLMVPANPNTVYQIGSIGKQFVATLIMMLVEENKIQLDQSVSQFLPEVPAAWRNITIRQLLTHTSGIKDYCDYANENQNKVFNFCLDYTDEELVKIATAMPFESSPGEQWKYSNTGYLLLGIIINRITGIFYGDMLQERIFKPLGMAHTQIANDTKIIPQRATGYVMKQNELKVHDYYSPTFNRTADGALYSTIEDLAKWDDALRTEKLLKKPSLDLMWTPVTLNNGKTFPYGFGWKLQEKCGHKDISHSGSFQGCSGSIDRFVDDNVTVIVLTNNEDGGSQLVQGIAPIVFQNLQPSCKHALLDFNF